MAEEQKVILEIQINNDKAIASIVEQKRVLEQLQYEQKQLDKTSEEGKKASEAYTAVIKQKTDQLRRTEKSVVDSTKAMQAEAGSIEANRAKLAQLTAEYIKLGKPTADQTKAIKDLSDTLKAQESAIGNNTRNVGNYREALGNLGGGFGNAISGVQGFNTALKANPIAAVVQIMNLLFDALGKNDNLMVAFQGTMKGIGVVVDNVSNFIAGLVQKFTDFVGSGTKASNFVVDFGKRLLNAVLSPFQLIKDFIPVISNLMDGNFSQALKAGGTAITNFGKNVMLTNTDTNALIESMTGLVATGTALEKGLDSLEEKQSELNVTLAENDKIVLQLRIQAKRRGEDTEAGIKLLERANKIESNSQKLRTSLIDEEIKIYENYRKTLGEGGSEEEQIRFKLNDLRVKRIEAEKQSLAILEKNANAEAALRGKQATAREKEEAEKIKSAEKLQKLREGQLEYEKYVYDETTKLQLLQIDEEIKSAKTLEDIQKAKIKKAEKAKDRELESIYATNEEKAQAEQEYTNALLDINKEYNDKKTKQDEAATKKTKEEADKEKAITEQKLDATLVALANFEKASAVLGEEGKAIQKALAISSAVIETYKGANLALGTYPPPFGAIVAASTVALGLANVSQIAAAAGGGDFVTTKPTLLLVGDNPGGRERVTVEPLSGRGQTKIGNSGLIAMAGGGSLTVNPSGMSAISSTASNDVFNQMALSKSITDSFSKLGNPVVSVVDIKKVSNKTTVTENKARLRA
jgi:hypothetical protein